MKFQIHLRISEVQSIFKSLVSQNWAGRMRRQLLTLYLHPHDIVIHKVTIADRKVPFVNYCHSHLLIEC